MQEEESLTQAPQRRGSPVVPLRQPCTIPSASPVPMWCSSKSEYSAAGLLFNAGLSALPVVRTGV